MFARLIALLATGEAGVVKRRIKTAVIAYTAAALAFLLALVFLLVSAYLASAVRWGAIDAAFWFGIGFVILTALILIVYKIVAASQRRAQQRRRAADASMVAGASAMAMLPAILTRSGGIAAVLLGVAGLSGYAAYRALYGSADEDAGEE